MASQDWFDKDFYKVLGVEKGVSDAELKKTYRKLARQFHPDSNAGDAKAEARFKEISEAYSVLSDPEQRAEYDQVRAMGSGARFTSGGAAGQGGFEDVFGGLFNGAGGRRSAGYQQNGFEDLLGGMFGGGQFGRTSGGYQGFGGPTRGRDLTASTTLDFGTAINGETITLQPSGGQVDQGQDPSGRQRRPEDQAARQGRTEPGRRRGRATWFSRSPFASIRCSSATATTCASMFP